MKCNLNRMMNTLAVFVLIGTCIGSVTYLNRKQAKMDTEPPVIEIGNEVIECSIHAENEELLQGVTAFDNVDGDITDQIMVSGVKIKKNTEGELPSGDREFEVTYVVFDSSGNMTSVSHTLHYTDYFPPRFRLTGAMRFDSPDTVDPFKYLTAEDCIDGSISGQITLEMDPCYSFGTYSCDAKVTNSLGDTAILPLTYRVVDSASEEEQLRPVITLTDYIVYIQQAQTFHPADYLESLSVSRINYRLLDEDKVSIREDTYKTEFGYSDVVRGTFMFKKSVKISSDVDVNVPGMYHVSYSYRHPLEKCTGSAELIVIVQ